MTHSLSSIIFIGLALHVTASSAQSCFYPDGSTSPVDIPCAGSAMCCPLNWVCQSNGLCHDPINNYLERRTCSDKSWQSQDCPTFCKYSAAGNEAIKQCNDGRYCCNGNGSIDCCTGELPAGTDFFSLAEGNPIASIVPSGQPAVAASTGASTSAAAASAATTQVSTAAAAPPANTCPCAAV